MLSSCEAVLAGYSVSISLRRHDLTGRQNLISGPMKGDTLFYNFFTLNSSATPSSAHDAWHHTLLESPEGVWFMLRLTYQLHTGHVTFPLIVPPSCYTVALFFPRYTISSSFFLPKLKFDDNGHNRDLKYLTSSAYISPPIPSLPTPILLFIFSDQLSNLT